MPNFVPSLSPEIEKQFASLRDPRKLTLVTDELEGAPLGSLPDNIYGYSYSPVNESTPLFARRTFQVFEVHKLERGEVHILGYLTPKEAQLIADGKEPLDLKLYPEPRDESTAIVSIPLERVTKARNVSRSDGNYLPLQVDPIL
jgi:hypothetical protein